MPKVATIDGLTQKQRSFIAYYLTNGYSAVDATVKAGYSVKTAAPIASNLLKHPIIRQELQKQLNQLQAQQIIQDTTTAQDITTWFKTLRSDAHTDKDYGSSCRANENLGKHIGYYEADNIQKAPVIDQAEEDKRKAIIDAQFEAIDVNAILSLPVATSPELSTTKAVEAQTPVV